MSVQERLIPLTAEEVFNKSQAWEKKLSLAFNASYFPTLNYKDLYNLVTDVVAIRYAYRLNRGAAPYNDWQHQSNNASIKSEDAVKSVIFNLSLSRPSEPDIVLIERCLKAGNNTVVKDQLKITRMRPQYSVEQYLIARMYRSTTQEWQKRVIDISNFEVYKWAQVIWRAHTASLFPADDTHPPHP